MASFDSGVCLSAFASNALQPMPNATAWACRIGNFWPHKYNVGLIDSKLHLFCTIQIFTKSRVEFYVKVQLSTYLFRYTGAVKAGDPWLVLTLIQATSNWNTYLRA